jgi:hypothetical protein
LASPEQRIVGRNLLHFGDHLCPILDIAVQRGCR